MRQSVTVTSSAAPDDATEPSDQSVVDRALVTNAPNRDERALIGQTGTVVVGSIGIVVALRNQNRQLNAQMSLEISGRFQELLRLFPTDAWLANRNPSQPLPDPTPKITECTLYALQFIADVYHLHKGGYISSGLWRLWEREIRSTLSGPVFQREWPAFCAEFDYSPDFVAYINSIMRRHLPRRAAAAE